MNDHQSGNEAALAFREFVQTIKKLRTPGAGCPWDLEQDHRSLQPYLVEETYEVLDVIAASDDAGLREELGDLLLQIVLHAQIAADRGAFSIADVVRDINEKMVRRHPHVFGSVQARDAAEVTRNWEAIKAAEKRSRPIDDPLADVPRSMPSLMRAQRLVAKAARAGLDAASTTTALLDQAGDAITRLRIACQSADADGAEALAEILFSLCRLALRLGVDAELALSRRNQRYVEDNRAAKFPESSGDRSP